MKMLLCACLVGIISGISSAVFLISLDWVTQFRESMKVLLWFLPFGGIFVGWIYHRFGKEVEAGNNLILQEVHEPKAIIPRRMALLVFLGTLVTHLFGGSAGREGTAVQMSTSLSDQLSKYLNLKPHDRKILLMSAISGGFSSVFGTPLAGTVFGFEVIEVGRLRYEALIPCFVAAIIGHVVTLALGAHHTTYTVKEIPSISVSAVFYVACAGFVFGGMSRLFASQIERFTVIFKKYFRYLPLRAFVGGSLFVFLSYFIGSDHFVGLGIPTMLSSFEHQLPPWEFLGKVAFTILTLSSGFRGGEVTPLFFIGATLGNSLSYILPLHFSLLSAVGFVGVFAGAANAPLSSSILAAELFGPKIGFFAAIACVVSFLCSGPSGIYRSQKNSWSKAAKAL